MRTNAVIVSQGSQDIYTRKRRKMQENFLNDAHTVKDLQHALSRARLSRYLKDCDGDIANAIRLYHWNTELASSLYVMLQMWEVTFRNSLHYYLTERYGPIWPYEPKLCRLMVHQERQKLDKTKHFQAIELKKKTVPTDAVVADLTIGFWAGLLGKSYDVPFGWKKRLNQVFPHGDGLDRATASALSADLADLRNRVAHHETIYYLDLTRQWQALVRLTGALNRGALTYGLAACDFPRVWAARPPFLKKTPEIISSSQP